MLRPEAKATLFRWREALIGCVLLAIGLRWVLTANSAVFIIGCGFAIVGVLLIITGIQRGRFRAAQGGAGVVEVDERRITYLGPFGGGAVAVDDIIELGIDPSRSWLVRDTEGTHLLIPHAASGGDALFDAFSALPGITGAKLVDAVQSTPASYTIIWSKPRPQLH